MLVLSQCYWFLPAKDFSCPSKKKKTKLLKTSDVDDGLSGCYIDAIDPYLSVVASGILCLPPPISAANVIIITDLMGKTNRRPTSAKKKTTPKKKLELRQRRSNGKSRGIGSFADTFLRSDYS